MRFMGNKENLLDKIYQVMQMKRICGDSFFDFFAGTTSVSRYFKKLNYQVFSSDLLYFSYVLQNAYIKNNHELGFEKLLAELALKNIPMGSSPLHMVVEYLNQIKPSKGFIYNNYTPEGTANLPMPRMYFSDENGKIIDAIRQEIEIWKSKDFVTQNEYFALLACLIETVPFYANITGVYAAFQKKWDPRAVKRMVLRPIECLFNKKENDSFNENSVNLLGKVKADILYLDPPYNQRQYAPNYHLLETIAKYDNPEIKGISGLRNYENQKSNFCNATHALKELSKIAREADYKTLILSYNSEGIMPQEKILSTLKTFGSVDCIDFEYTRFKSHNHGESKYKKCVYEQLYILQK